jgi:sporulation protein YlmC with PRC-barrel domain
MPLRKPLLVSFSLAAFASASVFAQQAQPQTQQQSQQPEQQQQQVSQASQQQQQDELLVSDLKDKKVHDAQGQQIGDIEDVVIDLQAGKVHAAVVEFGGVMGVGGKSYAFPLSEFQPGQTQDQLVLNTDKQKLENTEGFAKGQWPEMGDQYWGRVGGQQQASTGQSGAEQSSTGASAGESKPESQKLIRASDIIGKDVQDQSGQDVGEVKDMTVSLQDGSLKDVMLTLKGGGEAKTQASDLTAGLDDKLVISTSADQLKSQAQQDRQSGGSSSSSAGSTSGAQTQPETQPQTPPQTQPQQR